MGRPKLGRAIIQARVGQDTPERLKQLALELGFQWGANGNTGAFLDAIAQISPAQIKLLLEEENFED